MSARYRHPLSDIVDSDIDAADVSVELLAAVLARAARFAPDEFSRAQLAQGVPDAPRMIDRRDLPQASVSKAVKRFVGTGLFTTEEDRRRVSKRHYAQVMRIGRRYLTAGAHVTMKDDRPARVTTALCDIVGSEVVAQQSDLLDENSVDPWSDLAHTVHRRTLHLLDQLPADHGIAPPTLFGVGVEIGAPVIDGLVTPVVDTTVTTPKTVDLRDRFRQAFRSGPRFPRVPIIIENDAAALATLEIREMGYRFADLAVAAVFHAGVGGGLVMDGRIRRGQSGRSMEIGHLVVDCPPGWTGRPRPASSPPVLAATRWTCQEQPAKCPCGSAGHVDGIATPRSILTAMGLSSDLDLNAVTQHVPDHQARMRYSVGGAALGRALSHVCNIVSPSRLVVYLPEALTSSPPNSPQAEYLRAVKHEISVAFAVRSPRATDVKYRPLPSDPRGFDALGVRAAAASVLDSLIETAWTS